MLLLVWHHGDVTAVAASASVDIAAGLVARSGRVLLATSRRGRSQRWQRLCYIPLQLWNGIQIRQISNPTGGVCRTRTVTSELVVGKRKLAGVDDVLRAARRVFTGTKSVEARPQMKYVRKAKKGQNNVITNYLEFHIYNEILVALIHFVVRVTFMGPLDRCFNLPHDDNEFI